MATIRCPECGARAQLSYKGDGKWKTRLRDILSCKEIGRQRASGEAVHANCRYVNQAVGATVERLNRRMGAG